MEFRVYTPIYKSQLVSEVSWAPVIYSVIVYELANSWLYNNLLQYKSDQVPLLMTTF